MGQRLCLKETAVPHLHLSTQISSSISQIIDSAKKRKLGTLAHVGREKGRQTLFSSDNMPTQPETLDVTVTNIKTAIVKSPSGKFSVEHTSLKKSVGTQTDFKFATRSTNTMLVQFAVQERKSESDISEYDYKLESSYSKSSSSIYQHNILPRSRSTIALTEFRSRFYCGLPKVTYSLIKYVEIHGKVMILICHRVGYRKYLQEQFPGWLRCCKLYFF